MWDFRGQKRPRFAYQPGEGQESVWDYPRPPSIEPDSRLVEVHAGGELIAQCNRSLRVCETASPPTFYIPPEDVAIELLVPVEHRTVCEWKGQASYWALAMGKLSVPVAWSYLSPFRAFAAIRGWLCFYPGRINCFVDSELVQSQRSEFYGGWITTDVVGPFKGDPGTSGW